MKFVLTIDCDGAAFRDDLGKPNEASRSFEVARILSGLADILDATPITSGEPVKLTDTNGNSAGEALFAELTPAEAVRISLVGAATRAAKERDELVGLVKFARARIRIANSEAGATPILAGWLDDATEALRRMGAEPPSDWGAK